MSNQTIEREDPMGMAMTEMMQLLMNNDNYLYRMAFTMAEEALRSQEDEQRRSKLGTHFLLLVSLRDSSVKAMENYNKERRLRVATLEADLRDWAETKVMELEEIEKLRKKSVSSLGVDNSLAGFAWGILSHATSHCNWNQIAGFFLDRCTEYYLNK